MFTLKYEFDTMEEFQEAMRHLGDYHDCKKCQGKIVFITGDGFGNMMCGYCGQIVKYPTLKEGVLEEHLKTL